MSTTKPPKTGDDNDNDHEQETSSLLDQPKITSPGAAQKKKKITIALVVILVIVAVALAITLPIVLSDGDSNDQPKDPNIQEYNPYNIDKTTAFSQPYGSGGIIKLSKSLQSSNIQESEVKTELSSVYYRPINPKRISNNDFNKWASNMQYNITLLDTQSARLNIFDKDATTDNSVLTSVFTRPQETFEARLSQLGFQQNNTPFSFSFSDVQTGERLISTEKRKLVVSEKFSEIGFTLPSNRIFGLGQHNGKFMLQNGTYSLYSRGRQTTIPVDNALGGVSGNHIHPFLLCQTQNKDFIGLFFVSTSAQAFEIVYFPGYKETVVNYITLGGHLEVYFMIRGSAHEIISRYHSLIGKSQMPPYYALGVFQGTQKSVKDAQALIKDTNEKLLSIEGFQIDNYYASGDIFNVNDASLKDVSTNLHSKNQQLLLGLSAYYKDDDTLYAKQESVKRQISVHSKVTNGALVGKVDGMSVNYPDYFYRDNIKAFYTDGLNKIFTSIGQFDGVNLKGTEFYNEINGEVAQAAPTDSLDVSPFLQFSISEEKIGQNETYLVNASMKEDSYYYLPFIPGFNNSGFLDTMTISTNATRNGFSTNPKMREFYLHNANGHMGAKTLKAVGEVELPKVIKGLNRRALVLAESSWAGSGASAAALLTNLNRTYEEMRRSLSMAMGLSMYGFSNIMIDACGTKGEFDELMCARWMQVAAFLPMARNFYAKSYYDWKTQTNVANPSSEFVYFKDFGNLFMVTSSLQLKLSYSRYVYSQMYNIHQNGGAIVRPVFFDFPADDELLKSMDDTFMLGDSLLVAPLLSADATYSVYLPKGNWVNINSYSDIKASTGQQFTLEPRQAYTNVFLKQGKVVPYQQNPTLSKTTTDFQTQNKMTFLVHRDDQGYADGTIYLDDGISTDTYKTNSYANYKLRVASNSISFWVDSGNADYTPAGMTYDQLEEIRILNAADLMNIDFACYMGKTFDPVQLQISHVADQKYLSLKPVTDSVVRIKDIGLIKFGDSSKEANLCQSGFTYNFAEQKQISDSQIEIQLKDASGDKFYSDITLTATLVSDDGIVNVQMTTADDKSFHPEDVYVPLPQTKVTKKLSSFFTFTQSPFSYQIIVEDQPTQILYQSDPNKLFMSQYLVFDQAIFSMNAATNFPLMGMGERAGSFFYPQETNGIHSRYTFDAPNPIDDGKAPGKNFYGVQPFYAYQAQTSDFVGVFNLNAYGMDFVLNFNKGVNTKIANIMIGGTINKFFMRASTLEKLAISYQKVVGKPALTPLWSFGWQQCRYGYVNDQEWSKVVANYTANDLPLDVMWADIDYMDNYKTFTYSKDTYKNLPDLVKANKKQGIRFVPILDPGVAVTNDKTYMALKNGLAQDAFIKQSLNQLEPLTGSVWPGSVYFPDFSAAAGSKYWKSMLDYMHDTLDLQFDGIWLDMNEATNFCNGYCNKTQVPLNPVKNKPIYVPGSRDLETSAIGLDGRHANGFTEYDMHNFYGFQQVKVTSEYFKNKNLIPFVLSRSNFAGMGKFGTHWLGDNWSTPTYLALSVHQMYSYGLFGMPFVGSDVCGFNSDATKIEDIADLCTRWHQLGSFYPFARNHMNWNALAHEPYRFADVKYQDTTYMALIKSALKLRYNLIRYYYTQFYLISNNGGTFFKPLAFEWSNDPDAYTNIENNIMLGPSVKLSINTVDLKAQTTDYYFPQGSWCQIYPTIQGDQCFDSKGGADGKKTFASTISDYQVHLRGGSIIPYQNAAKAGVKNTDSLKTLNMNFALVPLKNNAFMTIDSSCSFTASAAGTVIYEDGVKFISSTTKMNLFFTNSDNGGGHFTFCASQVGEKSNQNEENVENLYILRASNVQMNVQLKAILYKHGSQQQYPLGTPAYDQDTDVLIVSCLIGGKAPSIYDIDRIEIVPIPPQ